MSDETEGKREPMTRKPSARPAPAPSSPTEQRTKITSAIRDQHVAPVEHVNFSISVGTRVPATIPFHPLPAEVIEIYPEWRGYDFILVGDHGRDRSPAASRSSRFSDADPKLTRCGGRAGSDARPSLDPQAIARRLPPTLLGTHPLTLVNEWFP